MAPWVPRLHLWEIDDQPWFPPVLRRLVQDALTIVWTVRVPGLQRQSPAEHVAEILYAQLQQPRQTIFIDFCSGAGGPTPALESIFSRLVRGTPEQQRLDGIQQPRDGDRKQPPLFIMTDLHPHPESWARAAQGRERTLLYMDESINAADAGKVVNQLRKDNVAGLTAGDPDGKAKVMRLFSLAFHHFDDALAKRVLNDAAKNGEGFAIFELQDRSFDSFLTTLLLGIGVIFCVPYFAWQLRSPQALLFTYLIPILPFVLVFDGWVSGLRTRTPAEVLELFNDCGARTAGYRLRSGTVTHLWPCGRLNWIVCERDSG